MEDHQHQPETEKQPSHNHSHQHHDHHRMMMEDFRRRFWISLVITLPILMLSPMIQQWLGLDWSFPGDRYLLFALSSGLFLYGGFPFLKGLVQELQDRSPGMMTLIAVAIVVAYGYSSAVVFGLPGKTFFWELATLIYLSKVVNMVQQARERKSRTQKLADRAAFWLTIIALAAGFGTLAVWLFLGRDFAFSLERMVTVMVISCPHALGLAIPLVADQIRPESAGAIRTLKKNGIRSIMLTGDNRAVAEKVSREIGIDDFFAGVLPEEKLEKIKELQDKGEFVAMTGDGVNDAPALAQADIGIAVGSGTDVAAETADIILVHSNPQDISKLILFGKSTYRKMVQNLVWATAYNVVAIPPAAGVLYSRGLMISPAVGAAVMSLSTVIVAVNAQLLRNSLE